MSNRGRKEVTARRERMAPAEREKIQSDLLVGTVGMLLAVKAIWIVWTMHRMSNWPPYPLWLWVSLGGSAGFAVLVGLLKAATKPAALMGFLVCMNLLLGQVQGLAWHETATPELIALFVVTFAATRFGRKRKERMGVAEERRGRRASQILANLGVAGLCSGGASPVLFVACVAALAEATADTVSSEMGQALGGKTRMITNWREVPAGTDGGVSVVGTVLGIVAALLVVALAAGTSSLALPGALVALGAAVLGLLFDSVLGATLERWGWMENDWVNFASTVFAACVAFFAVGVVGF